MPVATVERQGRSAVVHLQGDVVADVAPQLYGKLRARGRRLDVKKLVVDFSKAGRVDSSGVAVLSMVSRQLQRAGKSMELDELAPHHKAALALTPQEYVAPIRVEHPGAIEKIGDGVMKTGESAKALIKLILETLRQSFAVIIRKKKLPANALSRT
jgi:anti-anti-sigma factor